MRNKLIWGGAITWVIVSVTALLYYGDPVIVRVGEYPGDLLPCILNPLRDRGPEMEASKYLAYLKEGKIETLEPYVSQDNMANFKEYEVKCRLKSWRIVDRKDNGSKCHLIYWVLRESIKSEQEVQVFLEKRGSWQITDYSAVY